MNEDQRRRAGEALRLRIAEMDSSAPKLADKAGLSLGTVYGLIRGTRWPNVDTRRRIEDAVGWRPGEVARRAVGSRPTDTVADMSTRELLELLQACCGELAKRTGEQ
jgi:predicted transcriptional regulator